MRPLSYLRAPQPLQELRPFTGGARWIGLLILIDLCAGCVEINVLRGVRLPRAAVRDGPDLMSNVQHKEDGCAEVGEEKAVHGPPTLGEHDPAVGLQ